MKTFTERLEIILLNMGDCAPSNEGLNKATQSILDLVKESLPEECPGCGFTHEHPQICNGWNQYRTELLKRLGIEG